MPKRKMTKADCSGCEDNFYNDRNPYGVKECWAFKTAKIAPRKKVGMNDVPPWTWKPQPRPSCYRQKGYVFIDGDRTS